MNKNTDSKNEATPITQEEAVFSPDPSHDPLGYEITENKRLRQDLDVRLQELKSLPGSRERSLSRTKLEESIMWLGMDLKRLNTPNPYPNSKDPSNTIIEPTADGLKL